MFIVTLTHFKLLHFSVFSKMFLKVGDKSFPEKNMNEKVLRKLFALLYQNRNMKNNCRIKK